MHSNTKNRFFTSACVCLGLLALAGAPAWADVKSFCVYQELPLREVRPTGWLRSWLQTQASGLTGHIEVAGRPYDHKAWDEPDPAQAPGLWAYEQTGYWVDGGLRCGVLSGDAALLERTRAVVRYVLDHPDADGYLGPRKYKAVNPRDGVTAYYQWPFAVFSRALMAEYGATGDRRILDAMTRHYLDGHIGWDMRAREVCNVEALCWLYGQTGNPKLLALAQQLYAKYQQTTGGDATTLERDLLSADTPHGHGVSFAEVTKLGAILYAYTGDRRLLAASVNGFAKVARDHMLASGVYSSEEDLMGQGSLAAHETCDISDYTWSLGYLLMATGDAAYGDQVERAIFNAGFGAVTDDFKGLQYFSSPNQVVSGQNTSQTAMLRGSWRMSYRPQHDVECCTGNVNRMFPNYAARMWMTSRDGGLAATLYGPGQVEHGGVTVTEVTDYPYGNTITFDVKAAKPVSIPFALRIPAWCDQPALTVNGKPTDQKLTPGTFVTLRRTFTDGDKVVLTLPMTVRLRHWPDGGVSVERGPLVYSLKIEKDVELIRGTGTTDPAFPALTMSPTSPWNYALDVNDATVAKEAVVHEQPIGDRPWAIATCPLEIDLPARAVQGWDLRRLKAVTQSARGMGTRTIHGDFTLTPALPDPAALKAEVTPAAARVTLVPLGAAKLRVTVFPWAQLTCDDGLDERFDGRCPVGWDVSKGLMLNVANGRGELVASGSRDAIMKTGPLLLDFSQPVIYTARVDSTDGPWNLYAYDDEGIMTKLTDEPVRSGSATVDLSKALNWTGLHRFRVGFGFAEPKAHRATLSQLRVGHAAATEGTRRE